MHAPVLLVVTDDPLLLDDVRWQLGDHAATVIVARDSLAACQEIASQARLELVLIHLDGVEDTARTFSVLRSLHSENRSAKVIVLANEYKADEAGRLLTMGVLDYLDRVAHIHTLASFFRPLPRHEFPSVTDAEGDDIMAQEARQAWARVLAESQSNVTPGTSYAPQAANPSIPVSLVPVPRRPLPALNVNRIATHLNRLDARNQPLEHRRLPRITF